MRMKLAASGRFLAVVPAGILEFLPTHASIRKLPVELPTTRWPIGLITLKDRTRSPLAQHFIDCASEMAKPRAKRKG
jgi:DNA-binding transcriptional LysR family regulator